MNFEELLALDTPDVGDDSGEDGETMTAPQVLAKLEEVSSHDGG